MSRLCLALEAIKLVSCLIVPYTASTVDGKDVCNWARCEDTRTPSIPSLESDQR